MENKGSLKEGREREKKRNSSFLPSEIGSVVNRWVDRGRVVVEPQYVAGKLGRKTLVSVSSLVSSAEKWTDFRIGGRYGYEWDVTCKEEGVGLGAHACVNIRVEDREEWRGLKGFTTTTKIIVGEGVIRMTARTVTVCLYCPSNEQSNEPPPRIDFLAKRYPVRRYSVVI